MAPPCSGPGEELCDKSSVRHTWTSQQREALCLMYAFYENGAANFATIFNYSFIDLKHEKPIEEATLIAQFKGMATGLAGHDIFRTWFIERDLDEMRSNLSFLRNGVEDAARFRRIRLTLRIDDHPYFGQSDQSVSHLEGRTSSPGTEICGIAPRTPGYDEVKPPSSRHLNSPNCRFQNRNIRGDSRALKKQKRLPKLLYRFSSVESQGTNSDRSIVAGLFCGCEDKIPSPDDLGDKFFDYAVKTHLERTHRPTPFISMYDSLRPALQRACHTSGNAFVTIIDTQKACKVYEDLYGSQNHIYSAETLIAERNLPLDRDYGGKSEWLAWGSITSEAIIARFSTSDLEAYASSTPLFNDVFQLDVIKAARSASHLCSSFKYPAHLTVGEIDLIVRDFLTFAGLPTTYHADAASSIHHSWRLWGVNDREFPAAVSLEEQPEEVQLLLEERADLADVDDPDEPILGVDDYEGHLDRVMIPALEEQDDDADSDVIIGRDDPFEDARSLISDAPSNHSDISDQTFQPPPSRVLTETSPPTMNHFLEKKCKTPSEQYFSAREQYSSSDEELVTPAEDAQPVLSKYFPPCQLPIRHSPTPPSVSIKKRKSPGRHQTVQSPNGRPYIDLTEETGDAPWSSGG